MWTLYHYPVKIAINPVISTTGWILPGIVAGALLVSIVEAFRGGTQAMRRMYPIRADSDMFSYWAEGGTCELDTAAPEFKRANHH